ncbi:MAG: hypothetical protein HW380_2734 [Magnetococcales bacterium]|nr:hypothetical protein [Magnetococcales bacterium]
MGGRSFEGGGFEGTFDDDALATVGYGGLQQSGSIFILSHQEAKHLHFFFCQGGMVGFGEHGIEIDAIGTGAVGGMLHECVGVCHVQLHSLLDDGLGLGMSEGALHAVFQQGGNDWGAFKKLDPAAMKSQEKTILSQSGGGIQYVGGGDFSKADGTRKQTFFSFLALDVLGLGDGKFAIDAFLPGVTQTQFQASLVDDQEGQGSMIDVIDDGQSEPF